MLTVHASKQYKLKQWLELIQDYKSSGLTIEDWCAANRLKKHQYYYRLRKVREAVLLAERKQEIVAIPDTLAEQKVPVEETQVTAGELKIQIGNALIHVSHSTSSPLLRMVLEVMNHAQ